MPDTQGGSSEKGVKRRRITRACDQCHARSIKASRLLQAGLQLLLSAGCRESSPRYPPLGALRDNLRPMSWPRLSQADNGQCNACEIASKSCTYDRPKLTRGVRHTSRIRPRQRSARSARLPAAFWGYGLTDTGSPGSIFLQPTPKNTHPGRSPASSLGESPSSVNASMSMSNPNLRQPQSQQSPAGENGAAPTASSSSSTSAPPRIASSVSASSSWQPPEVAHSGSIPLLCEYYYQTIYPCTPLFHWPSFVPRIRTQEYLTNRPFCATVLSLCAVASARWRECGPSSIFVPPAEFSHLNRPPPDVPEEFLEAARQTIRIGPVSSQGHVFDDIRAAGLLTIAAVQFGLFDELAYWMGVYFAMAGQNNFHSEQTWSSDLSVVERDEMRHLVWLIYQHDVYTSVVVGGPILHREVQVDVSYPTEMPHVPSSFWIEGWNKTSDVYRVLEHACNAYRNVSHASALTRPLVVSTNQGHASALLTGAIEALRKSLPRWCTLFRPVPPGQEIQLHRLNFTALNLLLTFQNASIISLCARNGFTTEEGVAVAMQLVKSLDEVPAEYLQAMNMPLFYQLIGVGIVLQSGAAPAVTSQSTLISVQSILRDMSRIIKLLAANGGTQSNLIMNAALVLDKHVADLELLIRPSNVSADASALLGLPAHLFEWPADMPQFETLFPDLTMGSLLSS
ncbi:BQ2448_7327 [Microbotryum intermedium]|uniref:BQ2448_7327 protein n=1 Tax=Microbotryum intermedium TaxID=269621 RepID=A0A238FMM4_9BASI|nr:BQ2448_7327 [Microbotryum intermedium]